MARARRPRKMADPMMENTMTRNRRAAVSQTPEAPARAEPGVVEPMGGGLEAARQWLSRSLQAAQTGASWLQELQRQSALAATSWVETFALGAREAQQATAVDQLMAVPAHMLQREIEAGLRRFGESMQSLIDGEVEWVDGLRQQASALAPREAGAASEAAPLQDLSEPWRRAIGEWQSMAQHWADSLNAASATRR